MSHDENQDQAPQYTKIEYNEWISNYYNSKQKQIVGYVWLQIKIKETTR